jgi:protein-S-isoprenylcysteine O-methyltransferase Ste14
MLATWPISFALTHLWLVSIKERRLARQFGEEYSIYPKRVPRHLGWDLEGLGAG